MSGDIGVTKAVGNTMELLAPAGSIEVFEAAVQQGADAVYIGAPALNARALAKKFSYAEIAAMISFAHKNGVKVYVAMNSLLKEEEIPQAVEMLSVLESLQADAIIIQDLGIYHLAKTFFPKIRLHASTLLGGHNSLAVRQFERMGFKRVVLAREVTLEEIRAIRQDSKVELEVFIHGAMCFSYSGMCLFSSYLGGKSGLRGRCVQPCRRRYSWAGKGKGHRSGYFFSMNDLGGIDLLPQLAKAGVTSLKIEGRMRSANYVESVVKAYRLVLDGPTGDQERLRNAKEILQEAIMGRRETSGFFDSAHPQEILSPQHSGNVGLFLGKLSPGKGARAALALKEALRLGDRLRLHQELSGERHAFTLKKMYQKGRAVPAASPGGHVEIELPMPAAAGDSLYKVDIKSQAKKSGEAKNIQPGRFQKKVAGILREPRIEKVVNTLEKQARTISRLKQQKARPGHQKREKRQGPPLSWWVKTDDLRILHNRLPYLPDRVLISLTPKVLSQYYRVKKSLSSFRQKIMWALPPIIQQPEVPFYQEAVARLAREGFAAWQIGHIGQLQLFAENAKVASTGPRRTRLELAGDYTLNVLNSLSLRTLFDAGIRQAQVAIETDKDNLRKLCGHRGQFHPGLTVYGLPPLFTARAVADFFQYDRPFISPKKEVFMLRKNQDLTLAFADRPFSLLPYLAELAAMGVEYAVVDFSHMRLKRGEAPAIVKLLAGPVRQKKVSTFNYQGGLQ